MHERKRLCPRATTRELLKEQESERSQAPLLVLKIGCKGFKGLDGGNIELRYLVGRTLRGSLDSNDVHIHRESSGRLEDHQLPLSWKIIGVLRKLKT